MLLQYFIFLWRRRSAELYLYGEINLWAHCGQTPAGAAIGSESLCLLVCEVTSYCLWVCVRCRERRACGFVCLMEPLLCFSPFKVRVTTGKYQDIRVSLWIRLNNKIKHDKESQGIKLGIWSIVKFCFYSTVFYPLVCHTEHLFLFDTEKQS